MNKSFLRGLMAGLIAALTITMFGFSGGAAAQGSPTPDPNAACGRTLANFVRLLTVFHNFKPQAKPTAPDYCTNLEKEANTFTEAYLLDTIVVLTEIEGQSKGAFAFVDYAARKFVGVMPTGTVFRAVARNALPGSQMMLVKAKDFMVFVDYTFTTLTRDDFNELPDYREYDQPIQPFCGASWCRPPTLPPSRP